jgi:hypothetical protein
MIEFHENHPSGAKAHADFAAITARLKSCPFNARRFSAGFKARVQIAGLMYRMRRIFFSELRELWAAAKGKLAAVSDPEARL